MYSVLPVQPSVVFEPVAATSSPSFRKTASVTFSPFGGRYSTFSDESVNYATSELSRGAHQDVVNVSPLRTANNRCDSFTQSPSAERSTPLKPAKRDRTADDDDRQIMRCKRSLASTLKTAAASRLDGGSQPPPPPPSSTSTASESVERRNLRERRRVKLINVTFATLRNRLPSYCWQQRQRHQHQQQQPRRDRRHRDEDAAGHGGAKRPSKVDTLRTAISYIRCLQDLLADDDRQRMSTFQTFDAAAADTVVSGRHWTTSLPPAAVGGYDSCSPVTSMSSSSSEDVTTMNAATTSTRSNNNPPEFTDEMLDRQVTLSPLSDILDWLS